jgi:signal transduction histidine kinase
LRESNEDLGRQARLLAEQNIEAEHSGEALLAIIDDILDFSKVDAGKVELAEGPFSIRTVVAAVVKHHAELAQAEGLKLVAVVGSTVPATVLGDPDRVSQVLDNLIGNAVKFTSTGRIVVRVAGPDAVGTRMVVRFEVGDTGDGIAPRSWRPSSNPSFRPTHPAPGSTAERASGWPSVTNWCH